MSGNCIRAATLYTTRNFPREKNSSWWDCRENLCESVGACEMARGLCAWVWSAGAVERGCAWSGMLERSRGAVECGRVRSCVVGCAPVCPSVPHPKLRFTVKRVGWIPLKIVIIEKTSGRGPTRFKLFWRFEWVYSLRKFTYIVK